MIRDIVERHASEAAMLWSLRDAAVSEPHYGLDDLAALDERVEANIDGLRIAGAEAWDVVKGIVLGGLEDDQAGEIFAAAAVATDHGDLEGIAMILDCAGESAVLRRGIVSALGWVPYEVTSTVLPGLLDRACPPALVRLGIAGCVAHRVHPGEQLADALYSDDAALLARALHAVGALGQAQFASRARELADHADPDVSFFAAFALALVGEAGPATEALSAIALRGGVRAERAAALAARRGEIRATRALIDGMARDEDRIRRAVICAGALGDPGLAPWLLGCMQRPALARVAGEAFTLITGADLRAAPLRGKRPEGFAVTPSDDPADEAVAMDPDRNLPWPAVPAVERWWAERRTGFPANARHLMGAPIRPPSGARDDASGAAGSLAETLRRGNQRQRAAAALEAALARPGSLLFDVRAPAFRQRGSSANGAARPGALPARSA